MSDRDSTVDSVTATVDAEKGAVIDDHNNGQPPANTEGGENGQPEENEGGNGQPEENDHRKADEQDEDTVNNVQPETSSDGSSHAKSLNEAVTPEVLEILKKQQTYTLSSVTKCRNKLARLMIDKDNLHEVKGTLDTLNSLYQAYEDAHLEYLAALTSESDQAQQTELFEKRQNSTLEFRRQVMDWVQQSEQRLMDECSSATGSRHSRRSRSSRVSQSKHSTRSSISARVREKARIAELEIEQSMLHEKQSLRTQKDKLRVEMELAKARAREKILAADEAHSKSGDPETSKQVPKEANSAGPEIQGREKETDHTGRTQDVSMPAHSPLCPTSGSGVPAQSAAHSALNSNAAPFVPVSTVQSVQYVRGVPGQLCPTSSSVLPEQSSANAALNSGAPLFLPSVPAVSTADSVQRVSGVSADSLLSALSLPQAEVPKFTGDVTVYRVFVTAFDARVASKASSYADKLYYLDQHLMGEPKDLIAGCFYLESENGYKHARDLLEKEYGDPYRVSMAYLSRLHDWPSVKADDCVALRKLSLYLATCCHAMYALSDMNVLNHPPNIVNIVRKLPPYLQNKWREHAARQRQTVGSGMQFQDLVQFVSLAADTANDPMYSKAAMSQCQPSPGESKNRLQRPSKVKQGSSSFVTREESQDNRSTSCPMCHKQHDLDVCKMFLGKTVDDRRLFLKENRMCFGCYGNDHVSKGCTKKRTCQKCGKRHPTALHIDGFSLQRFTSVTTPDVTAKNDNVASGSGNTSADTSNTSCTATSHSNAEKVLHGILPVKIQQKGSDHVISSYCFYDNGSSGSFITDQLYKQLHATGTPTRLQLKTMHGKSCDDSTVVYDLIVTDMYGQNPIPLPKVYTREQIPVSAEHVPSPHSVRQWKHLCGIASQIPECNTEIDIGILIGSNCPLALEPLDIVPATNQGPYALRLRHGWTVYGPSREAANSHCSEIGCNRISLHETCSEILAPADAVRALEMDFSDQRASHPDDKGMSREDMKFLHIVQDGIHYENGRYTVPLPLRNTDVSLPDNKNQAVKRLQWQEKKMRRDPTYQADYAAFMKKILDRGYAELVPDDSQSPGREWYLPHHGIYHPNKPHKIRVVFDCSARCQGVSLNDHLLQGPDLANNLVGVLTRFRQEPIAFMADIEAMFFQVCVPKKDRSFFRFLWWRDGNPNNDILEYQMTVHLFGAVSSPSIANYVLKLIGTMASDPMVAQTLQRNFYVDDCLRSVDTVAIASQLIEDLRTACKDAGFNLTKFICNATDVMRTIPPEHHSSDLHGKSLDYDQLPITRALGVKWSASESTDDFGFSVAIKDKPDTRRGILSTVSSLYDPLGFVAPVILPAKRLLQDLCREQQCGWDDDLPSCIKERWHIWLHSLSSLEGVKISRCLKPVNMVSHQPAGLHVFSDASSTGYASVAYLRTLSSDGQVHVAFVAGKARVAPIKAVSIPRLELTAAVTSVRLAKLIQRELDDNVDVTYYTDSTTVLQYIRSENQRFPVFVANRLRLLHDYSDPYQWRYVTSNSNPADDGSRGVAAESINSAMWLRGPEFLLHTEVMWPADPTLQTESEPTQLRSVATEEDKSTFGTDLISDLIMPTKRLVEHFSDWYRLCRAVAVYRMVFRILKSRVMAKKVAETSLLTEMRLSVKGIQEAEFAIIRWTQKQQFPDEVRTLSAVCVDTRSRVSRSSSIHSLDPYLEAGILRVGGRIRRSSMSEDTKHPIILPKKSHITRLIIRHEHERLGHIGRNHTLSSLRMKYWVIQGNSAVRQVLSSCIKCRRLQSPVQEQKMADLPACRLDATLPPFSRSGVDYFGPFTIRQGRREIKHYGVLFTCMSSRAIHLEAASSLETDAFINVLRRFVARRGNIVELWSDNGSNFVGAHNQLTKALQEMDQNCIESKLRQLGISWNFNPPTASNMGGVWERAIRSTRKVLAGLLVEHGYYLNSDEFHTLLCEVEAILNSRPITSVSGDSGDPEPLTPNHILTLRSSVTVPPPGVFQQADLYMRRRWRRVQYLANLFWTRWKKEYIVLHQTRPKWTAARRNVQVGDVVIVKDSAPRNLWPLGLVTETESDDQGLVRAVQLKTQNGCLRRPVNKLVVLVPNETKAQM